jgi:hypothetical protein
VKELLENKHATIGELLEVVFSMRSAPRLYTGDRDGTAVREDVTQGLCLSGHEPQETWRQDELICGKTASRIETLTAVSG